MKLETESVKTLSDTLCKISHQLIKCANMLNDLDSQLRHIIAHSEQQDEKEAECDT